MAETIGTKVWESGLTAKVNEAYPQLDEQQLAGVFIRWETVSVTSITGEAEPSTGVSIRTGIQHSGGVENAKAIAALCGDLVEQAVSEHFGPSFEIQRVGSSEQSLAL